MKVTYLFVVKSLLLILTDAATYINYIRMRLLIVEIIERLTVKFAESLMTAGQQECSLRHYVRLKSRKAVLCI